MWREIGIAALALPLAIATAPLALALGALWLLWRLGVYLTAKTGAAEITGWTGEGDALRLEQALAHPQLRFVDVAGQEREFTSRIGYNIYDDPPPKGALPIRYHVRPFSAEIDDRSHWFTGPCLTIAFAVMGTFIGSVWRSVAATWF
jgi:hypothetical protein